MLQAMGRGEDESPPGSGDVHSFEFIQRRGRVLRRSPGKSSADEGSHIHSPQEAQDLTEKNPEPLIGSHC